MAVHPSVEHLKAVLPHSDILTQCMHCGMCLATCPTYELTRLERSSPRGRIKLIKAVAEGDLPVSGIFTEEMGFCLDCQACETACPAGVQYGKMVEAARVVADAYGNHNRLQVWIKRFGLNAVVAVHSRLKLVATLLRVMQAGGYLQKLLSSAVVKKIFPHLGDIFALSPTISPKFSSAELPVVIPAKGERRYRAALLTGCIMDVAFAGINKDTVEVLTAAGCEVVIPKGQGCCGSLHAHNGAMDTAIGLARANLKAFSAEPFDFLVSNSAGCGAFMKEYAHLFKKEPDLAPLAEDFSAKILDFTQFMVTYGKGLKLNTPEHPVTYHDACHLAHTQKITREPREMLAMVPGIDYRPLTDSTWCCGSAGIYNVMRYQDASTMLGWKMANITNTGALIVVTGNPGCMGQIQHGVTKQGLAVEVLHPATFIRRLLR